jgi:hypothetical protein
LDETIVVLGGIGDDDIEMIDGARVFDVTSIGNPGSRWRGDLQWARELLVFAGPAGVFFSDGTWLFSADEYGLLRWDPKDGAQTGRLEGFHPTHHHRSAGELVQLIDGVLVRWSLNGSSRNGVLG